jgi:hypothetical protein
VPADRKWFRNLAILERLVLALRPYRDDWRDRLKKMRAKALPEIQQIRLQMGVGEEGQRAKKAKAPRPAPDAAARPNTKTASED